jgi:hypothetical protein
MRVGCQKVESYLQTHGIAQKNSLSSNISCRKNLLIRQDLRFVNQMGYFQRFINLPADIGQIDRSYTSACAADLLSVKE